ncbi:hypothetical protein M413DRAFT_27869 [Hebeloma cylindrosporum]|uniref:Pierisin-like domain-containing protein n=1 Tax=Hebeloma cylindrosporum TaxID=76867 RepID=A0A0C2XV63_HEBCY|nr:hypothetical protein M413DRAFT_27869 [Hebeloma cylindrosporum h7]
MNQDFLCTSTIPWLRNDADNVIQNIAVATFGHDPGLQPDDLFRPPVVQDAETRRGVAVAYERLSRWAAVTDQPGGDMDHPNNVFHVGLLPRIRPAQGQFGEGFNLAQYVAHNIPSIFVGTTRYIRNAQGRLTLWQRRLTQATQHRFQYEIFAYGGIDVNHVLGDNHEYANQNEIAFPGGIRPQFIRSAREFQGTHLVAVWDNPRFDPSANGQHAPNWYLLPHIIRGTPVPVYFFTERDRGLLPDIQNPDEHHGELRRRRREAGFNEDELDAMHGPGEQTVDALVEATPIPRLSRACFLDPSGNGNAYFFSGNQYAIINVKPGTTDDTLKAGPKLIIGNWPSLVKAGFGNVDAILQNPNNLQHEAYFFYGTQYVLINTKLGSTGDYIINGPKTIVDEWPSLKQAGFTTVDAILPHPRVDSKAYFFSGDKYVLIKMTPGTTNDYIINGPKEIASEWPSLRKAGFTRVDAVLRNPGNRDEAYFFSGNQYALINIKPGTTDDIIVNGPKPVADNWPSLKQTLFY